MVLVAVAEDERIERAQTIDIGQKTRRRTFAKIEHEALAARLDQEARRALGADAGNEPQ